MTGARDQGAANAEDFEGEIEDAHFEITEEESVRADGGGKRSYRAFTAARALFATAGDDDEPGWLVEGLLPADGLAVLAAAPKTGKTWIVETIALALAVGLPLFGMFPTAGPSDVALFLCEDRVTSVRRRMRALCRGMNVDGAALDRVHLSCRDDIDIMGDWDAAWLVASVRSLPRQPALVVLDPLRDVHHLSETEEMDAVSRRLRKLVQALGCPILVVHHVVKEKERRSAEWSFDARGGGELFGRVDAMINVKRTNGLLEVRTVTRDGDPAAPFFLRLDIEDDEKRRARVASWSCLPEGKPSKKGGASKTTSMQAGAPSTDSTPRGKVLAALDDEPRTVTEIERERAKVANGTAKLILAQLSAEGLAREVRPGRWARGATSVLSGALKGAPDAGRRTAA